MTSANNLKQQSLATHNCADTNGGKLPPSQGCYPTGNDPNWGAAYLPSHFGTAYYFLLPYIEQDNVYKSPEINTDRDVSYPAPPNKGPVQANSYRSHAVIKTYQAPGDPSMPADGRTWDWWGQRGATSYSANWHVFRGGWDEDWQVGGVTRFPAGIQDGTSNTIFFAERYAICGDAAYRGSDEMKYVEHIWGEDGQNPGPRGWHYNNGGGGALYAPSFFAPVTGNPGDQANADWQKVANYPWSYMPLPQIQPPVKAAWATGLACNPLRVQAFSAGGILVGLGDGSVRTVSPGVSQATWGRACDPTDGGVLGADW
jgi:hypothetical protein